jgi:MEDS: MEthanogen/methylotroph, DcmR Sensory domain
LAAVEAVLEGRQFVSGGLSGHSFAHATDEQATDPCHEETLPSLVLRKAEITRSHKVEFYSDDAAFVVGFTRFIEVSLRAGNAVIVVATEAHRKDLLVTLQARDVDIVAAIEQGRYISLDVDDTLSTFMLDGLPDSARFLKVAGDLVAAAAKASKGDRPRVAACGECAPTLWAQGRADAAVRLEHLWDQIAKNCNVEILCGYVLNSFHREQESHIYERICAEHSAVSNG